MSKKTIHHITTVVIVDWFKLSFLCVCVCVRAHCHCDRCVLLCNQTFLHSEYQLENWNGRKHLVWNGAHTTFLHTSLIRYFYCPLHRNCSFVSHSNHFSPAPIHTFKKSNLSEYLNILWIYGRWIERICMCACVYVEVNG